MPVSRDEAYKLLVSKVQSDNLIRHCLAVEASMKGLANYFNEDEESWGIAGLLHDADWEVTRDTPEIHAKKVVEWLEDLDLGDEGIKGAILAHNHFHNGHEPPQSLMEWALYCCDELTGLIVACALVMPDKKLASVTAETVLNKLPQKSFAAGVDREKIELCEAKLGIALDEFTGIVLDAMKEIAEEISL
ncbi:MAG: HD domain-containing protein [Candidatus Berkelbacteria bacterium]|nr:MAG: HD domain-containing protein [Candidatus Berkelbacteria bacterium]QQG51939.1 MAG: HD domain-containing protein [Candidatus Berkelbacteria bacterium]